jgi:hypothetical protein
MFERPEMLWLLLAAPLAAAPGLMAVRAGRRGAGALAAALRLSLFAILVVLLAGIRLPIKTPARRMSLVVAMDASHSIAPDQFEWMGQQMAAIRASMSPRDRLAVLQFGRSTRLAMPLSDPRLVRIAPSREGTDPGGTDIAGALTTALSLMPPEDDKRIVLLTDGGRTAGAHRTGRARVRGHASAIVGGQGRDRGFSGPEPRAGPFELRASARYPERGARSRGNPRPPGQRWRRTGPSYGCSPAGTQPIRPAISIRSLRRVSAECAYRGGFAAGSCQSRRRNRGFGDWTAARTDSLDQSSR